VIGGRLHAVVVVDGPATLNDLGPVERVTAEIDWLRFGLQRLAVDGAAGRDVPTAARRCHAGRRLKLDAFLIEPLAARVGDRALVSCRQPRCTRFRGATAVASRSATRNCAVRLGVARARHSAAAGSVGDVVLVAGPDVARAEPSSTTFKRLYRPRPARRRRCRARPPSWPLSTAPGSPTLRRTEAFARTTLVLVSSRRRRSGDRLDLEALRARRRRSSSPRASPGCRGCGGGRADGARLGLARARDERPRRKHSSGPRRGDPHAVGVFHERLAPGDPPAAALATAQERIAADGPAGLAAAAGFLCLGGG